MRVLVWHWGRRGAGPLFAARLAAALDELPGVSAQLSLAVGAELLALPDPPPCAWQEPTYSSASGYLLQRLASPFLVSRSRHHLRQHRPDFAICAMPALLDQRMVAALHQAGIPYAMVVHDATAHPGDALSFHLLGQTRLLRRAAALFPLSRHIEANLRGRGFGGPGQALVKLWHPPFSFGAAPPPLAHGGPPRLLFFGRLLPYKGLDLLADALELIGPDLPFTLRICGDGPASRDLDRLRAMRNVAVEQRWIAEAELPGLLAWSDALILPYREASQSGVAAAALAQGRHVLATTVGGLPEQLGGAPRARLCAPTAPGIADGLRHLFSAHGLDPLPVDAAADWHAMAAAMLQALPARVPPASPAPPHPTPGAPQLTLR